jgi:hypothetical protein
MKLRKFDSYEDYVKEQTRINKKKINRIMITDNEIAEISRYIIKNLPNASHGICHGTRNGYEIREFRKMTGLDVIGTEISDTAENYEFTIQWDFHNIKDEWIEKFDFVYSNALDHSYNPSLALIQWSKIMKDEGLMFIEWSGLDSVKTFDSLKNNLADCFAANEKEYMELFQDNDLIHVETLDHKIEDKNGKRVTFVLRKDKND